jgi:mannose-6-phosphate isomerase-like protein (cupin superfamily)
MTSAPQQSQAVDLERAFATFDELWSPRIAARINDYDVKIAKGEGDYPWHAHPDTDELFLVLAGHLRIELEGREHVELGPLQVFTVPKGVRHRPVAEPGTRVLFIEPRGTLNSGDADVSGDPWVTSTTGLALGDT